MKHSIGPFSIFIFTGFLLIFACGNERQKSTTNDAKSTINLTLTGEELFIKHCKLCHGKDGKMAFNGAPDLTQSTLTIEEQITIVTEGKGTMTPYNKILSKEEIEKVATYAHGFANKSE